MRSIKEQHQQWCVHYRREPGMPKRDACQAGFVYDDITQVATLGRKGCGLRLPCIRDNHAEAERNGGRLFQCPKLQWPTLEESEAVEKEAREHMQKMLIVARYLIPIREAHRGEYWQGIIECPICKAEMSVTHHGCNNHLHVSCSTADCIRWME